MQLNLNIEDLHFDTPLPPLYRVRYPQDPAALEDIPRAIHEQLDTVKLKERLHPGMSIAVTAGSRGIHDIVPTLKAVVDYLKTAETKPFLVPAMGSHGGATAHGQKEMLAELRITEESIGCPIRSTMDVVEVGQLENGVPAYMDRFAAEADGVVVINRVKPHTDFYAPIESGLAKIIAIGLGKRRGAETIHSYGPNGLREFIPALAQQIIGTGKILCGLALLENASERTAEIVALPPHEIGAAGEEALLTRATELMGRLPFEQLDVLIVNEIGKNISGCGMDTNVIGRMRIPGQPEPANPNISIIVALDITHQSHGNASGIGLADLITARVANKFDFRATYINGLTAGIGGVQRSMLPIVLPTARDAISAALHCCAQPQLEAVRLVRIQNTLSLQDMLVSPALLEEARAAGLELVGEMPWEGLEAA
ncbi:MAG: lactate racemase domain-containing protein [Chloroflexota bacterium]